MSLEKARKKIKELTKKINYYNSRFFQHAESLISDYAFDQLMVELIELEKKYPELKKKLSYTARRRKTLSWFC